MRTEILSSDTLAQEATNSLCALLNMKVALPIQVRRALASVKNIRGGVCSCATVPDSGSPHRVP